MNKKYVSVAVGIAAVASLVTALPAFAQTTSSAQPAHPMWQGGGRVNPGGPMMRAAMKPGVFGIVSAINGDTITVTQKGFGSTTSASAVQTFTVNASGATVMKNNATSSVSAIAVGDMVAVQGTVSGTSVTATMIRDGLAMRGNMMGRQGGFASSTAAFTGNGEPITAGTVSNVNGSTITITNKSNVTYTIDASNAKIIAGQNSAATVSNIAVGDSILVQGTVNGSAVTASTIIDQAKPMNANASTTAKRMDIGGFFGGIGSFFSHLFGF